MWIRQEIPVYLHKPFRLTLGESDQIVVTGEFCQVAYYIVRRTIPPWSAELKFAVLMLRRSNSRADALADTLALRRRRAVPGTLLSIETYADPEPITTTTLPTAVRSSSERIAAPACSNGNVAPISGSI